MTIKIGTKGYIDLVAPDVGAKRNVRVVSFKGLAAAGSISGQHFPHNYTKKGLAAVIDVTTGLNATAYFRDTGSDTGNIHLSQVDTGTTANFHDGTDGHAMWAFITDTGT